MMAMFEETDFLGSEQRTAHKQIAPASIRIQSVKTRTLKGLDSAVDAINKKESALIRAKQERMMNDPNHQTGLVYANLGSQYDVSTSASTQGGVNRPISTFSAINEFERTEKAVQ